MAVVEMTLNDMMGVEAGVHAAAIDAATRECGLDAPDALRDLVTDMRRDTLHGILDRWVLDRRMITLAFDTDTMTATILPARGDC
jgi:hypothetical protein